MKTRLECIEAQLGNIAEILEDNLLWITNDSYIWEALSDVEDLLDQAETRLLGTLDRY